MFDECKNFVIDCYCSVSNMVRGDAILVILTIFVQLNTGSVFDKFSTPEKKDKNKMLMYLRGLLKMDTPTVTTPKQLPTTTKLEKIWASNSLPDRSDKSKMLAYLRGLKTPGQVYSLYEEPEHRGLIQTLQNQDDFKSVDQNINNDRTSALWANPATEIINLQPAEKESESDTCFWRGQQSNYAEDQKSQLVQENKGGSGPPAPAPAPPGAKKELKTEGFSFENMGEKIIDMWGCATRKFWKSYDRLQKKLCNVF